MFNYSGEKFSTLFGKDGLAIVELEVNISKNLLVINDSENKGKAVNDYAFEDDVLFFNKLIW